MITRADPAAQEPGRLAALAARWSPPLAACAVGAWLFVYYWRVIEHLWYADAFLLDFGWFNDLAGGRSLTLDNPQAIGRFPYYAVHVSPLLAVFGLISRLFGLQGVQPLALMLSLAFAGAGAMAAVIVERFLRPFGAIAALGVGIAAGMTYGLSGIARSTADYPHIEILYPPLALLTLHLLFQGRSRWAWAALAACLLTREDAGLHLATILGAYLVLAALDERGLPRRLRAVAPVMAAGIAYSALAILWQRTAWPDASTFSAIYAGPQPFKHINAGLYTGRLAKLWSGEPWLLLTLAAGLSTLPLAWRWTALTGLVASLPWLLLNLSAYSQAAGNLTLYYGFPFLATALVPLIVAAAPRPERPERLDVIPL